MRRPGTCGRAGRLLGEAAGSVAVGVRRIEVPAGAWATPAHDHAGAEELFYVLGGRGISWHDGVDRRDRRRRRDRLPRRRRRAHAARASRRSTCSRSGRVIATAAPAFRASA